MNGTRVPNFRKKLRLLVPDELILCVMDSTLEGGMNPHSPNRRFVGKLFRARWILLLSLIWLTFAGGAQASLITTSWDDSRILNFGSSLSMPSVLESFGFSAHPGGVVLGPDNDLYVSLANMHEIVRYDDVTGASKGVFV